MKILNSLLVSDHDARIGVEKSSLTIRRPDHDKVRVPLSGLERVLLMGNAQISSQAMQRCFSRSIRVVSLTKNGRIRFVVGGNTSGNVHLRVAQVRHFDDPERSLSIGRNVVLGKLVNSEAVITRWSWDSSGDLRSRLEEMRDGFASRRAAAGAATSMDVLRGVEGDAARLYFKGLGAFLYETDSPFTFDRRSRRPPRDPSNALLSFVYGLVTSEASSALESVGLDPQVGFLHGLRPGRPSLALDLVEEMRAPLCDRFVISAIGRRQLRLEHLRQLPGGAWRLTDDGLKVLFGLWDEWRRGDVYHPLLERSVPRWSLLSTQSVLLARHLRGDLPEYAPWTVRP